MSKKIIKGILTLAITAGALWLAFRSIDLSEFFGYLKSSDGLLIAAAVCLTVLSYIVRALRWQYLFPSHNLNYLTSLKVLILGFFMNNILPARTGELVRAHMGSKATGETRTKVLATIASERLADGLVLSLIFAVFSWGLSDQELAHEFSLVAYFFGAVTVAVLIVLMIRQKIFNVLRSLESRFTSSGARFALNRAEIFIEALAPLCSKKGAPPISFWSVIVWGIELGVYFAVCRAYGIDLGVSGCVVFMVAVNFSSLIPAAPGGLGVIELIASAVLVSIGIGKEVALAMVVTQHIIQYVVVGIGGAIVMLTWKGKLELEKD